jgi:hypothetical protein
LVTMRRSSWIIILSLAVAFKACIEPFEPPIEEKKDLMVIDGILNDQDSIQTITVSRSSPYNEPEFIPVTGCVVVVSDHLGETLAYPETEEGIYQARPGPGFASVGKAYKVSVFTPGGAVYESEYDTLLACPPIASLNYRVESQGTTDPDKFYYGIRFYLDVKGSSGESENYMWMYEETWEYHSYFPIHYIWDGDSLYDHTPELTGFKVCYLHSRLKEYQVGSSSLLSGNEIRQQPIHFVSNQSPRLEEKYSLLVLQHSLSTAAYDYLERLKSQSDDTGGLYESHPASAAGNIYNTEDPGEKVLGYFLVSQKKEKRIMVEEYFDFRMTKFYCPLDTAWTTDDFGVETPYYMYSATMDGRGPPYVYSYAACFNCLHRGGSIEKPEYWDKSQ